MRVRVSRVVLVGLPGSGKSTVGPLLARRLGWAFVDADAEVERSTGRSVAAIFRDSGEAAFRAAEREAVERVVLGERVVLAPGGGWAAQRGVLDALPEGSVVVWLMVSPSVAAGRLEDDPTDRPLLAVEDLVNRLTELDGQRTLAYSAASIGVDTNDETPEGVADIIAARLEAEYEIDGEAD